MKHSIVLHSRQPVIQGHKVQGRHLLPGLAYIDVLAQLCRKLGHDPLRMTLKELSIFRPLIVEPGAEVALDVTWVPQGDAAWRVSLEGRARRDGVTSGESLQYATLAVALAEEPHRFDERIDMAAVKGAARSSQDLADIYETCRERALVHDSYMQARGVVHHTGDAVYAECGLGEEAGRGASSACFHPVLIDGAALAMSVAVNEGESESEGQGEGSKPLYLPLFYGAFRASAPLQRNCIVRLRKDRMRRTQELVYLTLDFFDETGCQVAQLDDLTLKLVRESGLVGTAPVATPVRVAAEPRVAVASSSAEAFVRQLLAERLGMNASEVDVNAGYYALGLNSLGLMELVKAMSDRVGSALPPTLLFEHTTVASLASHLALHHADKFEQPGRPTMATQIAEAPPAQALPEYRPASQPVDAGTAIAIIGMSGRFPQADDVRAFWEKLAQGVDCIEEIPAQRWDWQAMADLRSPSGKPVSRWGGFMRDVDCFDPVFFRISPREAEYLDPQERLFLQESWAAIEDSGYTPDTLAPARGEAARRRVGVFAGVMHKDYALLGTELNAQGVPYPVALSQAGIANRVSFVCGFHGPSFVVDTLCSSSLVAVHLAVQSLRRGESEVAIAGGVNLSLHPAKYSTYNGMEMHSSDGRCRSFGKGGDGYVSAEAVGAVVLKPLAQAQADGDHIYAVIRGSSTNHVGSASGATVPSPKAQAEAVLEALRDAKVDARTIGYVEAHGTGTSLGDPIEIKGLTLAYRKYTDERQYCAIGSAKSNIGHAEPAAGICGLIKVALQLHHRMLVPSLHSEDVNPHLALSESPFFLQHEAQPWLNPSNTPRRAGLSSFGAAGSNAHLVIEEHEFRAERDTVRTDQPVVVLLSAKTDERLHAYAARLLDHIEKAGAELDLVSLAYTLQVGRVPLEVRLACVARDLAGLQHQLRAFIGGAATLPGIHHANGKVRSDLSALTHDEEAQELIQKWLARGKLDQLANLWVKGGAIDWTLIYPTGRPRRMSLPSYPFERQRHWLPEAPAGARLESGAVQLHPLVHSNTSDLQEQRYSSRFTGEEFFLREHVVHGRRVLPGVAQLEMAREAVMRATGAASVRLEGVVFASPIVVGEEGLQVHIALQAEGEGTVGYEIYSEGATGEEQVHGQGRAVLTEAPEPRQFDLQALRTSSSVEHAEIYTRFHNNGLHYGPAFQALQRVQLGQDAQG
ncbi:MAG: beta-ketoacyl synthase N-terminal-like domain-containing protein, partial [Rhizobacter sp.]